VSCPIVVAVAVVLDVIVIVIVIGVVAVVVLVVVVVVVVVVAESVAVVVLLSGQCPPLGQHFGFAGLFHLEAVGRPRLCPVLVVGTVGKCIGPIPPAASWRAAPAGAAPAALARDEADREEPHPPAGAHLFLGFPLGPRPRVQRSRWQTSVRPPGCSD